MFSSIEYRCDRDVDETLDQQIRSLLTRCFTGPQDAVFHHRRYFHEPCARRWFVRDGQMGIAAQVALHDKEVRAGENVHRIGGVAEVCVHPDFRGRGLVKQLLGEVHTWLKKNDVPFSVLLGDPHVYTSSGYQVVTNLFYDANQDGRKVRRVLSSAMVCTMNEASWPNGDVYLPGLPF